VAERPTGVQVSYRMPGFAHDPLAEARLRLHRASQHLEAVRVAIMEFAYARDPAPYDVAFEIDPKTLEPNLEGLIMVDLALPPPTISVIAGDCIYNLRGALEYAIHRAAILDAGKPLDTQFPIFTSAIEYRRMLLGRKGRSWLYKMPGDHRAAIRRMQPYQRRGNPHAHPLAILADLSNTDKHRTLNLGIPHLPAGRVRTAPHPYLFGGKTFAFDFPGTASDPGAKIRPEDVPWAPGQPEMDMQGQIMLNVAFANGLPVVETLDQIGYHVRGVVDEIATWFISK
jgi:hypothetical protein